MKYHAVRGGDRGRGVGIPGVPPPLESDKNCHFEHESGNLVQGLLKLSGVGQHLGNVLDDYFTALLFQAALDLHQTARTGRHHHIGLGINNVL